MKKGQSVIGTVILFVLFLLVFVGFLGLINWEDMQKDEATAARFTATNSELFLNNLLKRPTEVQLSGNAEVDTIADLVVYSYENSEARETLEQELERIVRQIYIDYYEENDEIPYTFKIVYPAGDQLQVGDFQKAPSNPHMPGPAKTEYAVQNTIHLPVPSSQKTIEVNVKSWEEI